MSVPYQPRAWSTLKAQAKRIPGMGFRRLYRAAVAGKLQAIRLNDRGDWATLPEWFDVWVEAGCPVGDANATKTTEAV